MEIKTAAELLVWCGLLMPFAVSLLLGLAAWLGSR
jgi:hypothetical protein